MKTHSGTKPLSRRVLIAGSASALGAASLARPAAAEQVIRLATQYNLTQAIGQSYDRWAKQVTDKAAGTLTVKVFRNRTLIDSVESFAAVKSGSVEASNMIAGFQAGDIPDLAVLQLPFLFDDHAHYRRTLRAGLFQMLAGRYADNNIKLLNYFPKGAVHIYSRGGFFDSPEALKGRNIRVVGGLQSAMLQTLGANPVTLPGGEVMAALQRGVVDGVITNFDGYIGFSYYQQANYVFACYAAEDGEALGINLAVFNALPPTLQKIMTDAAQEMEDENWKGMEAVDYGGVAEQKWADLKLHVEKATPAQRADLKARLRPLYDKALAELKLAPAIIKLADETRAA